MEIVPVAMEDFDDELLGVRLTTLGRGPNRLRYCRITLGCISHLGVVLMQEPTGAKYIRLCAVQICAWKPGRVSSETLFLALGLSGFCLQRSRHSAPRHNKVSKRNLAPGFGPLAQKGVLY